MGAINNFRTYLRHGFGVHKAWRFAFGRTLKDTLLCTVYWMLVWVLLGALIGMVVGKVQAREQRAATARSEYVQALEKIVAACLSDSPGRPITIDGTTHLCGIYNVGI